MFPTLGWILMAVLAAAALLGVWISSRRRRTASLRERFGPEYDHAVAEQGRRGRAESELRHRQRRVERLAIRPLAPDRRDRFSERWQAQQARFVDEPRAAIEDADHLVEEVMHERGYPVGEFEQRVADISVDHPRVVQNYRAAHEIAERERHGQASTEDLRRAMLYYRDLFMELLEEPMRTAPGH